MGNIMEEMANQIKDFVTIAIAVVSVIGSTWACMKGYGLRIVRHDRHVKEKKTIGVCIVSRIYTEEYQQRAGIGQRVITEDCQHLSIRGIFWRTVHRGGKNDVYIGKKVFEIAAVVKESPTAMVARLPTHTFSHFLPLSNVHSEESK